MDGAGNRNKALWFLEGLCAQKIQTVQTLIKQLHEKQSDLVLSLHPTSSQTVLSVQNLGSLQVLS